MMPHGQRLQAASLLDLQIITMGSARAVEKFVEAKRGKVSALLHPQLLSSALLLALL